MNKLILFAVFLLACIDATQLRFADSEMMKQHHGHRNPSNDPINVYLIPHSHDDVGWLKTVDNYYYGDDQDTQWAGVQYTIDTVVTQLTLNPTYKFSFVEVAFLYRWYNNANTTQRNNMVNLVKSGQIQFINAGWCMSDQATPYYQDMIDQMTIGFRWIKQKFNAIPRVGWHIDPFGHQASNAAMFSQMGFNSWYFARIDYQDKSLRMSNKGLQMIWHPTQYSGVDNSIFTHVNYYHYSPPPNFCFDVKCNSQPIKDDPTLEGFNIDRRSQQLVDYFKSMTLHYRSNNLLHTIGQDFHYANARMWYKNFDKLIAYINSKPQYGVNIKYATPSEYLETVYKENNTYPTKYDDFFPYADRNDAYWTGYFVSRVSLKGFVRDLGRYLQSTRTHISLLKSSGLSNYIKNNGKAIEAGIWELEMAMGILQHHDAVAGTAKQKVTNDYIVLGSRGLDALNQVYSQILKEQITNNIGETVSDIFTYNWNTTANDWGIGKALAVNKSVLVNIYNPGSEGNRIVKIKVNQMQLDIIGNSNQLIEGSVICSNLLDATDCDLFFSYSFDSNSLNHVKLVPSTNGSAKIVQLKKITVLETTITWTLSQTASLKFTRSLEKFDLTLNNQTTTFKVGYNYYQSYQDSGQKSGAYIFRPSVATIQKPKKYTTISNFHYAEANSITVVVIQGDKTNTRLFLSRLKNDIQNFGFEIQTLVKSIDTNDKIGKQVVLSFATNLSNNKTFFTDSNGLEEQIRKINYRPTWPLVVDQPVSGNYYPINSHIGFIDVDSKQRISILTDRSQGGSVINDGEIQIMIHRRCTMDDGRGVGQALNQMQDGVGLKQLVRHYVVFGDNNRAVQKRNDQPLMVSWSNTASSQFNKSTTTNFIFDAPADVKLYLRPFTDDTYLLRLHNFNTNTENSVVIPDGWKIQQLTLGANQLLSEWKPKKLTWKEEPYKYDDHRAFNSRKISPVRIIPELQTIEMAQSVSLKPFELKAFKLSKI